MANKPNYPRRFKMQVSKILIALAVAAGFASASFAQTATPVAPAAPVAEAKTEAAKPMVKKHHAKAKKVQKSEANTEAAPVTAPTAK
jgi:hypothetical protein